MRFVSGHNARRTPNDYEIEDRGYETPCWIWQRSLLRGGYGQKSVSNKMVPAHRVYYVRAKGPIPEGLILDHLCRQRACVNPDHLEPVTYAENARRGNNTKITPEIVAMIREAKATGGKYWGCTRIAAELGMDRVHIQHVANGKSWSDLPMPPAQALDLIA